MDFGEILKKLRQLSDTQKKATIIAVIIILSFILGFFWFRNATKRLENINQTLDKINLPEINISQEKDNFTYMPGDLYEKTKEILEKNGWKLVLSENEKTLNSVDNKFPEISDCGSGLDAVCSVEFKKDNFSHYLYLKSVYDNNGNSQWIVVGYK